MKNVLLIAGIICFVICVLLLLFAVLNLFGFYNVMDGSAQLYDKLRQRAIYCFISGGILGVAGAVCMILRAKF